MRLIKFSLLLLALAIGTGSLAGCVVHEHHHGFSVHPL
jgi:hypothetical protein